MVWRWGWENRSFTKDRLRTVVLNNVPHLHCALYVTSSITYPLTSLLQLPLAGPTLLVLQHSSHTSPLSLSVGIHMATYKPSWWALPAYLIKKNMPPPLCFHTLPTLYTLSKLLYIFYLFILIVCISPLKC